MSDIVSTQDAASGKASAEKIFDCHAHLVAADQDKYPPKPLSGQLAPGEFDHPNTAELFLDLMGASNVTASCAVQRAHIYGYDNSYILASSQEHPETLRAVVVLNAADPTTPSMLRQLVRERGAAGVRFVSPGFPSASLDWLRSDAAMESYAAAASLDIPICIHVLHVQRDAVLPEVRRLAEHFKDSTFVIDHVGGAHPAVIEQRWLESQSISIGEEFPDAALALADSPNVVMKMSTINLECSSDPVSFATNVVGRYGYDRVVWGSDLGQSRGDYSHMVDLLRTSLAGLPAQSIDAVQFGNADKLYGLR